MPQQYRAPLVIHPGFPRTASTSLQGCLTRDCGAGTYLGKRVTEPKWLAPGLDAVDQALRGLAKAAPAQLTEILERSSSGGGRFLLYSNEVLVKPWPTGGDWLNRQIAFLKAAWPDIRVLITIRNQADLMTSLYRNYLYAMAERGRRPLSFSRWLAKGGPSNYVDYRDHYRFDRFVQA